MALDTTPYVVADVFTDTPLQGNQLGVFTDARGLTDDQMQCLTREVNFSECAFVLPPQNGGDKRVRIFTPAHELPFGGHPILGAAFVLVDPHATELRLETAAGTVPIRFDRGDGQAPLMWMEQPVPAAGKFEHEDELLAALGLSSAKLPIDVYDLGVRHVVVALDSARAVAALRPDVGALARLGDVGVSCFAGAGSLCKTRVFAPALGVVEDPATGTAAGLLALHLCRHGLLGWGERLEISQGEEVGRRSTLYARAQGSAAGAERVEVGGNAVIVARGEFRV
jgi:trans-2,3-dihydro-3-hydroxyanthranilate isomerase